MEGIILQRSTGMDTLVVKGHKRISGRNSSIKGSNNIISNGSGIAIADGQRIIKEVI